jgi:hypothetical protein
MIGPFTSEEFLGSTIELETETRRKKKKKSNSVKQSNDVVGQGRFSTKSECGRVKKKQRIYIKGLVWAKNVSNSCFNCGL